jgi:hypothetical protein
MAPLYVARFPSKSQDRPIIPHGNLMEPRKPQVPIREQTGAHLFHYILPSFLFLFRLLLIPYASWCPSVLLRITQKILSKIQSWTLVAPSPPALAPNFLFPNSLFQYHYVPCVVTLPVLGSRRGGSGRGGGRGGKECGVGTADRNSQKVIALALLLRKVTLPSTFKKFCQWRCASGVHRSQNWVYICSASSVFRPPTHETCVSGCARARARAHTHTHGTTYTRHVCADTRTDTDLADTNRQTQTHTRTHTHTHSDIQQTDRQTDRQTDTNTRQAAVSHFVSQAGQNAPRPFMF